MTKKAAKKLLWRVHMLAFIQRLNTTIENERQDVETWNLCPFYHALYTFIIKYVGIKEQISLLTEPCTFLSIIIIIIIISPVTRCGCWAPDQLHPRVLVAYQCLCKWSSKPLGDASPFFFPSAHLFCLRWCIEGWQWRRLLALICSYCFDNLFLMVDMLTSNESISCLMMSRTDSFVMPSM